MSFVQIRGSAPLFWAEVNNLRYKPDLQIMEVPETVRAQQSAQNRAHLPRCLHCRPICVR